MVFSCNELKVGDSVYCINKSSYPSLLDAKEYTIESIKKVGCIVIVKLKDYYKKERCNPYITGHSNGGKLIGQSDVFYINKLMLGCAVDEKLAAKRWNELVNARETIKELKFNITLDL